MRGGETNILKREDKLDPGVGALKRGDWNPLTNYGFSYCFDKLCPIRAVYTIYRKSFSFWFG